MFLTDSSESVMDELRAQLVGAGHEQDTVMKQLSVEFGVEAIDLHIKNKEKQRMNCVQVLRN